MVSNPSEPARDTTPAAPLPDYARGDGSSIDLPAIGPDDDTLTTFYNLQGIRVDSPRKGSVYILVKGNKSTRIMIP